MYCFNGRIAQPLEHTTTLGGEKSTSRCQTFPLMWTFGEDHLVIPRVTFIYWTTALPFGTINININSWMIRLIKIKKGMSNRVKIKIFPRSIYYLHGETQNLYKQDGILVPPGNNFFGELNCFRKIWFRLPQKFTSTRKFGTLMLVLHHLGW